MSIKKVLILICLASLAFAGEAIGNKKLGKDKDTTTVHYDLDEQQIQDWIDNLRLSVVLDPSFSYDLSQVTIDRNFRDYLERTEDKEQTERRNGED